MRLPTASDRAHPVALAAGVAGSVLVLDTGLKWTGIDPWGRANFRGRRVSLLAGPALTIGTVAAMWQSRADRRLIGLLCGVAAVGFVDDGWGHTHARGLTGHWRAAHQGQLTTGSVKLVSIAALSVGLAPTEAALLSLDRWLDGLLIAGGANLINLLDLRPGRALKVLAAALLPLAGIEWNDAGTGTGHRATPGALALLGGVAGVAPWDLGELAMIGDCGANSAGAATAWLLASRLNRRSCLAAAAVVVGLNLVSERVSFSQVIEAHGWLRDLDRLGRRR